LAPPNRGLVSERRHPGSPRGHGTNWHWLATFEKVFIPDLQAQKRFSTRVRNGLVQSPWATAWAIGSGVPERGCAHRGSLRGHGTNWHWLATFEKVFIPDLQAQKRFSTRVRNGLVQSPSACT